MKVLVNKCKYTGKLFESDSEYSQHLAKLRGQRSAETRRKKRREALSLLLEQARQDIETPEQLAEWVVDNFTSMSKLFSQVDTLYRPKAHCNLRRLSLSVSYSRASNTHCAPRDGVTNWNSRRNPELPTFYPGFTGTIAYTGDNLYMSTDILRMIGIHTGAGGGGGESRSYAVTIFISDWPGITQTLMTDTIKGIEVFGRQCNVTATKQLQKGKHELGL